MAWFNKGPTANYYMSQARDLFERALTCDPNNIEALVGTAQVDIAIGGNHLTDDRATRLAAAETALIKALSIDPRHPRAHMYLGIVQILTNRADQGIAESEQALSLDRNLANAHANIGVAKFFLGRASETEAHVREAFRLSPRDTLAYRWMTFIGIAKLLLSADDEAVFWLRRSIESNRNYAIAHLHLAAALALLGSLDEARAFVKSGLILDPSFSPRRFRATGQRNPTFLAGGRRVLEGMRMAGVPEG